MIELVRGVRNARSEARIEPAAWLPVDVLAAPASGAAIEAPPTGRRAPRPGPAAGRSTTSRAAFDAATAGRRPDGHRAGHRGRHRPAGGRPTTPRPRPTRPAISIASVSSASCGRQPITARGQPAPGWPTRPSRAGRRPPSSTAPAAATRSWPIRSAASRSGCAPEPRRRPAQARSVSVGKAQPLTEPPTMPRTK